MFEQLITRINQLKKQSPVRMTTDFKVVSRGERPDVEHASFVTMEQRLVAIEGKNNLFQIHTDTCTYDLYGGGSSLNPERLGSILKAFFVGFPEGDLTKGEAIEKLSEFEGQYPESNKLHSHRKQCPHYSQIR